MSIWQSLLGNLKRHRHRLPQARRLTRVRRQHQVQGQGHDRLRRLEARRPEAVVPLRRKGNQYLQSQVWAFSWGRKF